MGNQGDLLRGIGNSLRRFVHLGGCHGCLLNQIPHMTNHLIQAEGQYTQLVLPSGTELNGQIPFNNLFGGIDNAIDGSAHAHGHKEAHANGEDDSNDGKDQSNNANAGCRGCKVGGRNKPNHGITGFSYTAVEDNMFTALILCR